jgi:hypothetical protein
MSDDRLLPCLKPADWDGAPTCVGRRFTVGDLESEHLPWLAFGYDRPHAFEFLSREALGVLDRSEEEAEAEAFDNLRARTASWERTSLKLGEETELDLLVAIDDYFSAEKMLDVAFMSEGGKLLDTDALAVGIPCRGVLMATRGKQDMELLGAFAAAVSAQFHHPNSPPITPAVFALFHGEVVGMLQGGEDLGRGVRES